jgi:protoheme IX farnesyltransferase
MKFIGRVAWVTTAVTYLLIALGGTVLATSSLLNCSGWPFCSGAAPAFLEQFSRFTAVAMSILLVLLVVGVAAWVRRDRVLLTVAIVAPLLLAAQTVLGGLTALRELPPQIIVALVIFAILIAVAMLSGRPLVNKEHPAQTRKFARLAISNVLLVYFLMLLGSYVSTGNENIALLHDTFAVFVGLVMLWTVISALRRWRVARWQALAALVGGILFVAQAVVGGLIALHDSSVLVAGLHLALATAVWCVLVLLAALASAQLRAAPAQGIEALEPPEVDPVRQIINNYIDLVKPHVTVLLLGVTVAAMAIAKQGLPSLALVIPTLLGGAMAAGSANCINCYIDRDIDQIMGRTQRRSLPAKRVEPLQALVFGILLGIISFFVLAFFVNLLSAVLALSAILFYVFVYTLWLKRTSVQNIVIGGAAGAVPVLVGWAAITNSLSWTAVWLFAIIFFWTPPHFWALSLLIQKDYEKAGVPMMPVVKGEEETRRQILYYSVLLLAITLVLFAIGSMGYLFLIGGVALGGGLVYLAVRLWRERDKKWARTLFWYSNMYLAAIFAVMVLDRIIR